MIVKDPNKSVIRLYDIPDSTFESDDDDDDDDEDIEGKFLLWFDEFLAAHRDFRFDFRAIALSCFFSWKRNGRLICVFCLINH